LNQGARFASASLAFFRAVLPLLTWFLEKTFVSNCLDEKRFQPHSAS
jgi:hypothetical protein